jgi:hypothetical protein
VLGAAASCVQAPRVQVSAAELPALEVPVAQAPQAPAAAPTAHPHAAGERWTFGASAYTYFVPGDRDYVQPTITADRGQLHLEARYNYEALDTGSLWAGWTFAGGGDLSWEIMPMLGAVFGQVDGVAPGYKGSLDWRRFELYSEG